MSYKNKHNRQYDIVVFGANGYTGKFAARHIAEHLPTSLVWAIAGRNSSKLQEVAKELKALNPDRRQPEIEIAELNDDDMARLAKKTFVLVTTVGPYGAYGEFAFKACAENGTHYLDVTGEVPFTGKMTRKYDDVARKSGAIIIPQAGIESMPPDVVTWVLAKVNREELQAKTKDVTISIHQLNSAASGGTLTTALTLFDNFTFKEYKSFKEPFALSPVPHKTATPTKSSLYSKLTGMRTISGLGTLTTALPSRTDGAIAERSWGLLQSTPGRKDEWYGPNFSFNEYYRARNWFAGFSMHWGLIVMGTMLATMPPFRRLLRRFVYQPGDGPDVEKAKDDYIEYRGIATPDLEKASDKKAFCRAHFHGSMYYLSGLSLAQGALTLLEDDLHLGGGVATPACLGQGFVDRLEANGFKFETKVLSK